MTDLTRYKHNIVIDHPLREHYLKLQDYIILDDNWIYKTDKWLYNVITKKVHEILEVWDFENTEQIDKPYVCGNSYIPPTVCKVSRSCLKTTNQKDINIGDKLIRIFSPDKIKELC